MAQIMQRAGVACTHEKVFTPDGVDWGTRWGDSSWMAAPHLSGFDGPIIRVVRHPLDVLTSIHHVGFFDQSHPNADIMAPYRDFAVTHSDVHMHNPMATAAAFMRAWYEMVTATHTVKVENIDAGTLGYLTHLARVPRPSRPSVLQSFLAQVPTDWNRPGEGSPERLTWSQVENEVGGPLFDWLRQITSDLGYDH